MPILPDSAKKILSKLQQTTSTSAPTQTLPSYQPSKSEVTLFDDLPEHEKRAAIAKLHRIASEQPGSTTPAPAARRRRCFNWKTFAMVFLGLGFVAFATVASVALAVDTDKNADLVSKLRMANTNLDRMNLLPSDSDWFFDFTKQDKYTFTPGGVVNANAATFPATVGQGMTMVSQTSHERHLCLNIKLTSNTGHAQLGPLLHASTPHPPSCYQLRRRHLWYHSSEFNPMFHQNI
jgi:hypothetical protein